MNHKSSHRFDSKPAPFQIALALGSACLAFSCGSERLSLGAGEAPLTPGDPACGGGVVQGSVEVHDQGELEALAGCEEIVGDLRIHAFAAADLRPLAALRIVRGDLTVGGDEFGPDLIESLDGLNALEQVSRLSIRALGATDLSPLANLKRVELDPLSTWDEGGTIEIAGCPNLTDLTGLGGLERWEQLILQDDESLSSLDGLGLPLLGEPSIRAHDLPALRDVSALADRELHARDPRQRERRPLSPFAAAPFSQISQLRLATATDTQMSSPSPPSLGRV